jgi:shikimate dehydrogenase
MLVSQAVHAIEIFIDTKSDNQSIQKVYENTYKSKQNIVLIGMPSSGKTTVGSLLAKQLNRELIDIDDELVKRLGCPIAEYFKSHSEKEFRDIETEITKDISKRNGIIIATGGGCILREENVNALRLNGRLYFLDRSLENLTPTDSRPLASKKSDIEALFRARYHIYESVCDAKIDGNLSPDEEANLITEEFYITK